MEKIYAMSHYISMNSKNTSTILHISQQQIQQYTFRKIFGLFKNVMNILYILKRQTDTRYL